MPRKAICSPHLHSLLATFTTRTTKKIITTKHKTPLKTYKPPQTNSSSPHRTRAAVVPRHPPWLLHIISKHNPRTNKTPNHNPPNASQKTTEELTRKSQTSEISSNCNNSWKPLMMRNCKSMTWLCWVRIRGGARKGAKSKRKMRSFSWMIYRQSTRLRKRRWIWHRRK